MATAIGGSIQEISIRGRIFPVAADADVSRQLGGWQNEVQANGDGSARIAKTRVPWVLGGITVQIDDDRDDQGFLKEVADSNDFVPITITFASGTTYQGKGTVSEELEFSSEAATADLTLSGPGELTPQ